nr:hypothetical protein [Tanacetum cinerariifolium]
MFTCTYRPPLLIERYGVLCSSSRSNLFRTSNQVVGSKPTSGIKAQVIDNKGFGVQVFLDVKEQQGIDRLNIKKLNGNILQKHGGSKQVGLKQLGYKQVGFKQLGVKQVGFKQLGSGVKTGFHGVHDEKRVWFEVELQGAQGDRKAESGLSKVSWVKDTTRSIYLVNMSPSLVIRFKKPIDMLGFFGWLASIKQEILEPVKFKCIFLGYHKSIVANKLWKLDDVTSKVVLYRNIGFNESGEYKKTFIGFGVGTGSMQVLHEFEFEVEPLRDHTFEVEPQENVNQGDGLQEYREDSNADAFEVAAVEKIYAHESLTFNNIVVCEVISKWKARLKDDMDARSDVYVLSYDAMVFSCECKAVIWATKGLLVKAKGNILNLEIIRDQSGNTLRVSQSRIHNEKLIHTLLKGHSTLSLEDSLSMDCDVKKCVDMLDGFDRALQTNVQVCVDFDYVIGIPITIMSRSITGDHIYAVGSQEYQMVCTRPDIASAGVDMLDGFNRGLSTTVMSRSVTRYELMILGCAGSLKANLQHMEALLTTEAGYVMFTEAWKRKHG